jgi:hypothetical protein
MSVTGKGMCKVAVATVLFGLVHSLLASEWAKERAVEWFGEADARAWYRPFYLGQSLVLVGLLILYIRRQPGEELYHATGVLGGVMRAVQVAVLALMGWALFNVGLDFMTGWDELVAWSRGADIPPMPDGQGPAPQPDGTMRATGPFAFTRHPLNWFMLPLFWLNPRMTTRLLAFNFVVTLYVVFGSVHLESRLADTYGAAYQGYEQSVPFFTPMP